MVRMGTVTAVTKKAVNFDLFIIIYYFSVFMVVFFKFWSIESVEFFEELFPFKNPSITNGRSR